MSTVMYSYWIKKGELWETRDRIREFVIENDALFKFDAKDDIFNWNRLLREMDISDYEYKLQLFEINGYYLARVISPNYLILNNYVTLGLKPCFYDDRSDMPPEDVVNKKYARELDKLITKRHYFMVPIIDREAILDFAWKQAHTKVGNSNDIVL